MDSYSTDDGTNRTTVIETRSRGNGGLMIGLIVLIALVAAIAFFLFTQSRSDEVQADAVVGAAQSVGDAAEKASRSISDAADRVSPEK